MSDDESAIRRLLADYCHLLDDGRFDEWIVLFDEDVVFTVMGNRLRGRDEVRSFIEPTQQGGDRGRHMLSEPVIDVDDWLTQHERPPTTCSFPGPTPSCRRAATST